MYLKMYMRIWILSHRRIAMNDLCSSSYAVIHVWAIKLSCTWCYAFETIIAESRNLDLAQLNRYYRIIDRWAVFTGACPPVLHRSEGTRWGSTTRLQPKRETYYVFDAYLFHRRTFRLTLSVNPWTRRHTLGWEREHVEEENCIFLRCRRRQLLLWPGEWSFF